MSAPTPPPVNRLLYVNDLKPNMSWQFANMETYRPYPNAHDWRRGLVETIPRNAFRIHEGNYEWPRYGYTLQRLQDIQMSTMIEPIHNQLNFTGQFMEGRDISGARPQVTDEISERTTNAVADMPNRTNHRARPINIQPQDRGFIVTVGCQSFAIETIDKLVDHLNHYLRNPSKVEEQYAKGEYRF